MYDLGDDEGTLSPLEILFKTECVAAEVYFLFPVLLVPWTHLMSLYFCI